MTPRWARRRRGTVLVLMAICLVPMVVVMAMVLDGGMLLSQRRQAQAVADAAARAAACSLYSRYALDTGLDPLGKAAAAGRAVAAANGFSNDGSTSSVAINVPPSSASANFAGKAGCAEAVVTYHQPRYFSAVLGPGKIPIRARAVAQCRSTPTASILLTDPSMAGALTLTGGARLTTNAGVQVNSGSLYNASTNPGGGAVIASNGAYMDDNGGLSIVGNYNIPGWATPSTFFDQAPTTGQAAMSDPYAGVAAPTTAGLTTRPTTYPGYGKFTIDPGVYDGGLTLGGGAKVTMAPGIYYMKDGGLSVGNGVTLTGDGVTIYLDDGGGSLSLQGGAKVTLSAPTTTASGGIPGIVVFQDRANTTSLNNIANGADVKASGAIYAPNASLSISGGASGAQFGSQLIVRSLNLSNGVDIKIETPGGAGKNVSRPVLAE